MIYDELNYAHEADIFANQMKYVKPLQPVEVFKANLEAGNPDQLMIRDLVESYGLTIGNGNHYGEIAAITTLESIYLKFGYHILKRVIRLILATWEGDKRSFSANMMNAVCKICVIYRNQLDEEVFKDKLGVLSIKEITRTANERRQGHMGYAKAMVLAYNGKKKTASDKLPLNQLYAHDISYWSDPEDFNIDFAADDEQIDTFFEDEE